MTGGRPRPVAPRRLPDLLADLLAPAAAPDRVFRVAVDGAAAVEPGRLADALIDPLRVRSRVVLRVSTRWFLRPASVRLEAGRTDPDAFYDGWLDANALRREVLDAVGDGAGRYLPSLLDPDTDRATRGGYLPAPGGAVLLVDGALLLGRGLPFDRSIHLRLSPAALARRTEDADRWTLPAFARYEAEVDPAATADVVVRLDDPRHPAVIIH